MVGRSEPSRGRGNAAGVALFGLVAALVTGCKQPVLCPPLDDCGGDPTGTWLLAPGHPSCMEDLYLPPADTRLIKGTKPSGQQPYPEPALYDWCLLLVTGPGSSPQVKPPIFFYESGQIGSASIRYENGSFSAGLTRTGTFSLDLPEYCVRAFGATDKPDPADPSTIVSVCKQLELPIANAGIGEGAYPNVICSDSPFDAGGCVCQFDVTETGGPGGAFQILNGNTIVHFPGSNFPQKATFCAQGDRLQLTGADGAYLFDQRGLRTFDLVRAMPQPQMP